MFQNVNHYIRDELRDSSPIGTEELAAPSSSPAQLLGGAAIGQTLLISFSFSLSKSAAVELGKMTICHKFVLNLSKSAAAIEAEEGESIGHNFLLNLLKSTAVVGGDTVILVTILYSNCQNLSLLPGSKEGNYQ